MAQDYYLWSSTSVINSGPHKHTMIREDNSGRDREEKRIREACELQS